MGQFEGLYSISEAAEMCAVDTSTLRRAIKKGKIKEGFDCRKFGKQWVLTYDAISILMNMKYFRKGAEDLTKKEIEYIKKHLLGKTYNELDNKRKKEIDLALYEIDYADHLDKGEWVLVDYWFGITVGGRIEDGGELEIDKDAKFYSTCEYYE